MKVYEYVSCNTCKTTFHIKDMVEDINYELYCPQCGAWYHLTWLEVDKGVEVI